MAACGGVFRNTDANFVGAFAEPVGLQTTFFEKLFGALRVIELSHY